MSLTDPVRDHPVKRFGGADEPYDGVSAVGWHVVLRDENGELESLSGPHETWHKAMAAFRDLLGGTLL